MGSKWQDNDWGTDWRRKQKEETKKESQAWSRSRLYPGEDMAISDHIVPGPGFAHDWEQKAYDTFSRDGFVILTDVLTSEQCSELLRTCESVASQIVDEKMKGNRGQGRYSFGVASSTGSTLHIEEFAKHVLDSAGFMLHPLLKRIFAQTETYDNSYYSGGHICCGGGGDFVLGGVKENQDLHADLVVKKDQDMLLPPPMVIANFSVQEITSENGPMRIVPGSQLTRGELPEQEAWWQSWLCPLPAGAAIVRDPRTMHSGTRNLTNKTRYLPSVEYVSSGFRATNRVDCFPHRISLPLKYYERLRPEMKTLCAEIVDKYGSLDVCPPYFTRS